MKGQSERKEKKERKKERKKGGERSRVFIVPEKIKARSKKSSKNDFRSLY